MDIQIVTQKYAVEDPNWSIDNLITWLVEKKGVTREIAEAMLMEVIAEAARGREIQTHHEFDNIVLGKCREYAEAISRITTLTLQKRLDDLLNKERIVEVEKIVEIEKIIEKLVPLTLEGGYWKKLRLALMGKI